MSKLLYKALYFFKKTEYLLSMALDKQIIKRQLRHCQPKTIDLKKIKKILLVRNDGIGDMIITTPFIRILAQHEFDVSVMSQKSALQIIQNNPHVKQTFIWDDRISGQELAAFEQNIQQQHFDLAIDMRYPIYFKHSPHKTIQSYYFGAKYNIGWNKSAFPYFDLSIKHYTRRGHYITLIQKFLTAFNIHETDLHYEFFPSNQATKAAHTFVNQLREKAAGAPIIILNPYTGHHRRDMSLEQIKTVIEQLTLHYPQCQIIAIGIQDRIKKLISVLQRPNVVYFNSATIMDVVPLIEASDLVISPDTSIVHLVAAFQKPLVALYASGRRTAPSISTPKNRIKEKYHETVDEARAHFFDLPNVKKGVRPKGKMLLVEGSFGPNNKNAIQLKNYTHQLSEIPAQSIAEAADRLLIQHGFSTQ